MLRNQPTLSHPARGHRVLIFCGPGLLSLAAGPRNDCPSLHDGKACRHDDQSCRLDAGVCRNNECFCRRGAEVGLRSGVLVRHAPVSYTHLDVYKRQCRNRSSRQSASAAYQTQWFLCPQSRTTGYPGSTACRLQTSRCGCVVLGGLDSRASALCARLVCI